MKDKIYIIIDIINLNQTTLNKFKSFTLSLLLFFDVQIIIFINTIMNFYN